MKKLFSLIVLAGIFTACNNTSEETTDTSATGDTLTVAPATVDTTSSLIDTTKGATTDTGTTTTVLSADTSK